MNTEIINAGYYRITLRFAYEDGRIINYILPENNEFYLYVQVVKGKVILNFEGGRGFGKLALSRIAIRSSGY